jgi:hypothetical protein
MIQPVADEEAYTTWGEVTKNVAKTIQKKSLKVKSKLTIFMSQCSALRKTSYTRDKDLMDFEIGYLKKKKKKK